MKTKLSLFTLLLIILAACAPAPSETAVSAQPETAANTALDVAVVSANQAAQPIAVAANEVALVPVAQTQPETAVAVTTSLGQTTDLQRPCPTEDFIAVSASPANSTYAAPELNTSCSGDTLFVSANGIPTFEFVSLTPNGLSEQNYQYQIPLNPVAAATPTDVPLLGAIAFAVDGMPIFAPNEAPRDNYGDAYLDGLLDYCNGHTAQGGTYHYHARPDCLFDNVTNNPDLVIGYALDGYPILAPYACTDSNCTEIVKIESSYQQVGDGYQRGDNTWEAHVYVEALSPLDECNGMTLADGSYAYFATDTFPYILGCYHGVVATNGGQGGANPAHRSTCKPKRQRRPSATRTRQSRESSARSRART